MLNSNPAVVSLGNAELLAATREILRRACVVEADLLVHLAEIEDRRLHSEMAFPTMFAFCVDELGFSEDQAWNRTTVARAARRIPAMLESLRSGAVHLTGLRLLAPHLRARATIRQSFTYREREGVASSSSHRGRDPS